MITVVIPAYNEEKFLPRCLGALKKQTISEAIEIIVVDNNCKDNSRAIAIAHGAQIVDEFCPGVGAARRTGTAAAKGDIIITIDADTVLPPQYAQAVRALFDADTGLACWGGIFTFYDAQWWQNLLRPALARLVYWGSWILTGGCVGPMGNNMVFRQSDYFKTRGFNSALQFGEDMDLVKQLRPYGKVVLDFNFPVATSARRYRVNKDLAVYAINLVYYCFTGRPWRNILASH